MNLYIAEKPSLAKTIADSLGVIKKAKGHIVTEKGIVTWCFGHLYEQLMPDEYNEKWKAWLFEDLPIIPNDFKLKIKSDAKEQVKHIAAQIKSLKKGDFIVNCGDPDREGQLLVDEVINLNNPSKIDVKRAWLKDLTASGLKKTLNNLVSNKEYENLSISAETRSQADWLVGLNLTRAYTCKARSVGHASVLTIGRVQTPTLNLVVERDRAILNFKPKEFYEWAIELEKDKIAFVATESCERLFDKEKASSKKIDENATVTNVVQAQKTKKAPLPFCLSSLQADANKKHGLSAQKVLDTVQSLYETHKIVSYPRTDCSYLSEADFEEKKDLIQELVLNYDAKDIFVDAIPKCYNDKKVGAHTAIIPLAVESTNLSDVEEKVFDMIKRQFLSCFLDDFKYDEVIVKMKSGDVEFKITGKTLKSRGFMSILEPDKKEFENSVILPDLNENETLEIKKSFLKSKKTTPPKSFTEGTLIKAMANIGSLFEGDDKSILKDVGGIGTEATRAAIIDKLKENNFLTEDKKNIKATKKSHLFMSLLGDDIKSPLMTANWESQLAQIEKGELSQSDFIRSLIDWLNVQCETAKNQNFERLAGKKCPSCKDGYLIERKSGKGTFTGCNKYPECKYIEGQKKKRRKGRR